MSITLSPDDSARSLASRKRYCIEELDLQPGELPATLFLDFILAEIGPSNYNGGVADAQVYVHERVAEVDGVCYESEFRYWAGKSGGLRYELTAGLSARVGWERSPATTSQESASIHAHSASRHT